MSRGPCASGASRRENIVPRTGTAPVLGKGWSGRRDLNPRLQPWQGCTLPLSYARVGTSILGKSIEGCQLAWRETLLDKIPDKNKFRRCPPDRGADYFLNISPTNRKK